MGFYDGLSFFIALTIGLIPAVILGLLEKSREKYIMFFSLVMIFLIYKQDINSFLYFIAYIFLEISIIAIYQQLHNKYGKNSKIFHSAIVLAILPLVISKISIKFIGTNIFGFIGISYITFRVLQIIIETYDNIIPKNDLIKNLNFLLFFPSISSGPIDRSRRYENDINTHFTCKEYVDLLQSGARKILLGILYKFVISDMVFSLLSQITGRYDPIYVILYAYLYGIYMFFDFGGYSLMAVGTGYILGIKVPDNFNKPFISLDIKDFWNRWHISLSHWLRDFVFSRFLMTAIRKKWFKKRINAASSGFIINMLIMGAWHGLSFSYILYGLYHGVLLALTEYFQKLKWYKEKRKKKWFKPVSWFVTLNLVMFGFLIFSGYFAATIKAIFRLVHISI